LTGAANSYAQPNTETCCKMAQSSTAVKNTHAN